MVSSSRLDRSRALRSATKASTAEGSSSRMDRSPGAEEVGLSSQGFDLFKEPAGLEELRFLAEFRKPKGDFHGAGGIGVSGHAGFL